MTIYNSDRFSFTLLRPTKESLAKLSVDFKSELNYAIYGLEIAPVSGVVHFQGYFETKKEWNVFKLKKQLPGYYIEPAKSDKAANIRYCSKSGFYKIIASGEESSYSKQEWTPSVELFKDFKKLLDKHKDMMLYC